MPSVNPDILAGFVDEATGYLPAVRAALAAFRADRAAPLDEAHRCVHTIKGAAGMVGLADLSHVAFYLEDVVERLLHEPDTATPDLLDGLDIGVGHVGDLLAGLAAGVMEQPDLAADAIRHARALAGVAADAPLPKVSPLFPLTDDLPEPAAPDLPEPPADEPVLPELLEVFRLEAEDHVRALTTLLPEAKADPGDRDRWQTIRRAAHTLKGTAGMVGFHDVTRLSHRMEDLLDLYYEAGRPATPDEIDLLISSADLIAEAVEGRPNPAAFADRHAKLEAILGAVPAEPEAPAAVPDAAPAPVVVASAAPTDRTAREAVEGSVRVPIERVDEVAKLVGELVIARTALEQRAGELSRLLAEARPAAERLRRVSSRLDAGYEATALAGSRSAGAFAYAGGGGSDGFDDLEFDRYTEFHLLTRELAETTTDVQTVFGEFAHLLAEIDGQLTRQARLASEAEDKLMRLRMVPVGTVAAKLQRTVRTAAATAGKEAAFVLDGERTGLDKAVLEAMADPLLHLLRNAVDHGLEPPEVRRALGKPAAGTVTLKAAHEGSHVVLTLADDGRGIDFDRVRAAAVRRGLATDAEAAALTADELAAFLFRPGFTTREAVTELSGRGVGLDVVKAKVEALKGTVAVTAAPGRGTTFTVRLPMTLAVVRALLVRAGGQTYALPLDAVEQILRPGDGDVDRVGRDPVLRVGGGVCPLVPLARLLRLPETDSTDARPPVVVLKANGRRIAVRVDALLGGREIVVKSLGGRLRRLPGVSGATLLGDGSVVLILNPDDLARGAAAPAPVRPIATAPARARDRRAALVVDDSPSVRRVLTGLLAAAGWEVTAAKDGLEALELLQRGDAPPDVVLTDVEMPRMDGYELLATLRADATLGALPVAVLTSRAADKHRKKALDLGAAAYVVKPFRDDDLLEILGRLAAAGKERTWAR